MLGILATLFLSASAAPAQWPGWRGPEEDGSSKETGLPASWSREGENLAWKVPIGSRSAPVVLGDRVYLLTRGGGRGPSEHERVVCLAAGDGKLLWEYRMPIFLTDIPSNRVGWSNPAGDAETGNVYVHGVQGLFLALDRDGKLQWSHSLTEEYGRFSGYGGRIQTPLIDEDLVIISFLNSSWGAQGPMWHRFLACDKKTGEVRWWSSPGRAPLDTNYSSPVVANIKGVRMLIAGSGDGGVHGLKVRTGEPVWAFNLSKRGINSSVVVEGEKVFVTHSEENIDTTTMGRLVAIDATGTGDAKEIWRVDGLEAGYASPALHQGRLYVVDNGANLTCFSTADGKVIWKHPLGTVGKGSPVWADGKIYVGEVNGKFHIVEDGPQAKTLDLEQFKSQDGTVVEVYGSPAVAGGRVYFSTRDETFAIGPKEPRPVPPAAPAGSPEPADPQAKPAHLQLLPSDVVLKPGETLAVKGKLFDSGGRFLRAAEGLTLSLKGLRGMLAGTQFTPQGEVPFQAGLIEAKAGDLAASTRVRVVRPLPVKEDFEKVEPKKLPEGWIGLSPLKFQVVERDGSRVLQKLANNARFQRVEVYLGLPDWRGYAIQGDVLGTYARRNLPDIGLIGCRYTFYLTKNPVERKNIARMVAWLPMPRLSKEVAFDWKPDVWYRLKMRVDPKGEGGVARGKVWARGDPEPAQWTIEMDDPLPTFEGSPGLVAYTPGITERSEGPLAFFDNLEVTLENSNP
jgi:outer membrane protein assembly factor BamB